MIVVLGRPGLERVPATAGSVAREVLHGPAAAISMAAVAAGSRVELVGSIGDDPDGDLVAVLLGRAGIGHAALLRDPAGRTAVAGDESGPMPRLDGPDVALGLGYLADVRVMVVADRLPTDAEAALLEAAGFHGAAVVAIVAAGGPSGDALAASATVLEAPDLDATPFTEMVGRYAAALDRGDDAAAALTGAATAAGWERSGA